MSNEIEEGKESIKLTLTERSPTPRPGVIETMLEDLRQAMPGMLSDLGGSGRMWARGKSEQEVARAKEIVSQAIERIGKLSLEEQDQIHRHGIEREKHDAEMERARVACYLESLDRVIAIAQRLTEMGAEVDIQALIAGVSSAGGWAKIGQIAASLEVKPTDE
ncbi:hypothetical protein [Lacipirellula parvula]|uniref:Uncharacterized protein n=1 Tax=Lacipirellula parvula TaxID=2650471 RepID=A0A5K7X7X4_9BACT|nr:hypothetical protein [Lacipirellula parvula]BBO31962.1 hypothetical protein PLANPX_1574 [Lacipirellula parvula]